MSEHEAINLKTINLSAQLITVQQECAKINSARNIVLNINRKSILRKLLQYLLEVYKNI